MDYNYNNNYGAFIRNSYSYPEIDYEYNPSNLNFGLEYSGTVAAVWVGSDPNQYAYCELIGDTSLKFSHSGGILSEFKVEANQILLNTPLVQCQNEIRASLGTFTNLSAPYKLFDIVHPTKVNKRLRHACIEGPEIAVYIRGKLVDNNIIKLPDYWEKLVDPESITVTLTQIKISQDLIVDEIDFTNKTITINSGNESRINCYYMVAATRNDVLSLEVEIDG